MTWTMTLAASDVPSKSLLEYIAAGGPIGAIIIVLSLAAVALVVTQVLRVRLATLAPADAVDALDKSLSTGDVRAAETFCEDPAHASFLTRVVGSALLRCGRSPFGFLELRTALEEAGQRETARLYRFTDAIGLIASVAPMLGLLGTVVGMVGAFDTITLTDGPARPDQLAGNISVALVTTVLGLIVAIPCTAAYTFLRNRIDALTSEIAEIIEDLAAHLEGNAAPAAGKAPRA